MSDTEESKTLVITSQSTAPAIFRADGADRYVLFPLKFNQVWHMYKKHEACFWTAEELDLSEDHQGWEALNDGERHFVKMVLAFFAASDGIVLENLSERFMKDVQIPEARCFYGFQIMIENIHSEVYSLLIDTYVKNEVEKNELFRAVDNFESIRQKAQWALQYITSADDFLVRLVGFAAVEGIFFSGSFCAIFWLKHRKVHMPGLILSNKLISRDEGLHTDFACLLYSMSPQKLDDAVVHKIIKDAVEIEIKFITESLPVSLIGMNSDQMAQYIKFCSDRLLVALGHPKIYNATNPFEWMAQISLIGKDNFFEKRTGDYAVAGINHMGQEDVSGADRFESLDDF
jgi:ribonucleotide reductase beta subunit family protein with ferritin-like domain